MTRWIVVFPAAMLGAGLAGFAIAHMAPLKVAPGAQAQAALRTPEVADAQRAIAAAGFAFRALHPPPPPISVVEGENAQPPELDISIVFRRDVTAVLEERGRSVVVIVDEAAKGGRRVLRAGARYRDGWKVAAISPAEVELRRGREKRRIDLFSPLQDESSPADSSLPAHSSLVEPRRAFIPRNRSSSTQKE